MPAGSKPGERRGGRRKGIPNKASIARQARVAASGITPLDLLLKEMRYHDSLAEAEIAKGNRADRGKIEASLRAAGVAAEKAAPFVHPKLSTLQSNVNLTGRLTLGELVDASIREAQAKAEAAAAQERGRN